ncbi:MAG: hypothetical protein JJU00_13935 [Opitutales bacterium]|nr:hypothetical protein [Opitutales bacterium]
MNTSDPYHHDHTPRNLARNAPLRYDRPAAATPASPPAPASKLVDAQGLLNALFEEDSRPSLRWLRQMQAQRRIPYVKIGRLVRFDVDEVRAALAENSTVRARVPQRMGRRIR